MRSVAFVLLWLSGLLNGFALAAKPPADELVIRVGDPIQDVKESLEGRKTTFSQDSLAVIATEPYLTFTVDPKKSFAIISYNEATKKVSTLGLMIHPPNRPQKSDRSLLNLRSLTLHEGGDYTIRVAKDGIEKK
jgi:hypothetical protein